MVSFKGNRLAFSTGDAAIDARIRDFLEGVERIMPSRLRAAYLTGSWRDGSAVSRSDVDVVVVFHGRGSPEEYKAFVRLVSEMNAGGGPELGPWGMDDDDLVKPVPAYLKAAALLWGEDVLADRPLFTSDYVMRRWALGSLKLMQMLRGRQERLEAPLVVPNPEEPYLGYALLRGGEEPSTKLLVSAIARIAGARGAEAGFQPRSKKECCTHYRARVGDAFSDFVEESFRILKEQWEYGLPTSPKDVETLRRLCGGFLQMENDFLGHVGRWVMQAEGSADPEVQAWASQCRGRALFS